MVQISGIEYEKNTKGENTHIRINLKKFGKQLQPFLEQIGVIEAEDDFDKEWENSISRDELVSRVHNHLESLKWKK